jgi:DnaJ-class molecular chaperone
MNNKKSFWDMVTPKETKELLELHKKVNCRYCHGQGVVRFEFEDHLGNITIEESNCIMCNGTGKRTE